MIAILFGFSLFSDEDGGTWLSRELWPTEYMNWLSQLDDSEESSY